MLTRNAQPAPMSVSLAVLRALEREAGLPTREKVRAVAGLSLGEYEGPLLGLPEIEEQALGERVAAMVERGL